MQDKKYLGKRDWRQVILRKVFRFFPFDTMGGWTDVAGQGKQGFISCLIVSSQRPQSLSDLLEDLAHQTLSQDRYEVVIVLNNLSAQEYALVVEKCRCLPYIRVVDAGQGIHGMAYLRNLSLQQSSGEFILLLDDDTRIFQNDFLSRALELFKQYGMDAIVPRANALYGLRLPKYDFLDRSSLVTRCCLCTREALARLGGFLGELTAYEDIELSIRMGIKDSRVSWSDELEYFHPPQYFDTMRKPLAIGRGIFQMKQHYSGPVWLCVYLNALRFLPYGLVPTTYCRQWFNISWGVLAYPFIKKQYHY